MKIRDRIAILVCYTYKFNTSIITQYQIIANIIRPICKTESRIKYILSPAPLIKSRAHRNCTSLRIPIIFCTHIIVLKCLERGMQFFQRCRHLQSQIVQPCFIDHRELRDRINTIILIFSNTRSTHTLP